jgi:hypothetical protein
MISIVISMENLLEHQRLCLRVKVMLRFAHRVGVRLRTHNKTATNLTRRVLAGYTRRYDVRQNHETDT